MPKCHRKPKRHHKPSRTLTIEHDPGRSATGPKQAQAPTVRLKEEPRPEATGGQARPGPPLVICLGDPTSELHAVQGRRSGAAAAEGRSQQEEQEQ